MPMTSLLVRAIEIAGADLVSPLVNEERSIVKDSTYKFTGWKITNSDYAVVFFEVLVKNDGEDPSLKEDLVFRMTCRDAHIIRETSSDCSVKETEQGDDPMSLFFKNEAGEFREIFSVSQKRKGDSIADKDFEVFTGICERLSLETAQKVQHIIEVNEIDVSGFE